MQCHKPGHRAPARCVSALLAAGALLATVADQLGGSSERPAIQAAALGTPMALSPAPMSALLAAGTVRPVEYALSRTQVGAPSPQDRSARPKPAAKPAKGKPAAKPAKSAKGKPASKAAHPKASHPKTTHPKVAHPKVAHPKKTAHPKSASKPRSVTRGRPAPDRHTNAYLLAHLPPAKNPKAAKAVHEALSLLGVPYRWGGTTRAGFDCSGFTQHVWAVAGVKIPRTVRDQARAGTQIPLSKAEPGDLVVFYPTQHHVGIYVGNGLVIDSPHSGTTVRPDPVRSMPVSVVVRVRA
ncbi:C40 family peptidase [Catenulispora sp. NL8]|uniref:C40 family peptidase n=1 Tax=Catenulispora pinistramenti TaxID=2705254 RepID=A0ABS5L752_9ACTN|nr:C40 family peptidase [Catenulispora pinistramenti]MBS2554137.1 C40 family peptidase [Catenulispora pinistramenti]